MADPPYQPGDVVGVADAVQKRVVLVHDQAACEAARIGKISRGVQKRRQPPGLGERVWVEQDRPVAVAALCQAPVVGSREAGVVVQAKNPDARAGRIRRLQRVVGARVVHHDDPVRGPGLAADRFQAPAQQAAAVVVDDDQRGADGRPPAPGIRPGVRHQTGLLIPASPGARS